MTSICQNLVLRQTAAAAFTAYTKSFHLAPDDAINVQLKVLTLDGGWYSIDATLESTLDTENWSLEVQATGLAFIGVVPFTFPTFPAGMPTRLLRVRFDLYGDGTAGAIVALEMDRAQF